MIPTPDAAARAQAQARLDRLTKPPGSLGRLETLALDLAAAQGRALPRCERALVLVCAGDHGVAAQGVSAFPAAVTAQMVANFGAGGAAVNVLARQAGADLVVVNAGVATPVPDFPGLINRPIALGTRDFTQGPAMTRDQCRAAQALGRKVVAGYGPCDVLVLGEMGIANTTSAAALMAALMTLPPAVCCGRGTGVDDAGLARKVTAVTQGLKNLGDQRDPEAVLAHLGGFEIAALVGAMTAAAEARIPVVLDGFITTAAALVACAQTPGLTPYLVASHRGAEAAHGCLLDHLGCPPLLDLGLRLGEASGGVLALPLLKAACRLLAEMATFDEAGVSDGPSP